MKSLVTAAKQIVDCRELLLTGHFFSLTKVQADEMAREFYHAANGFFDYECVLDWKINQKPFKDFEDAISTRKLKNGHFWLEFNGAVRSDKVYSKTTLRRYRQEVMYPSAPSSAVGANESVDFTEYYEMNVLGHRLESTEFKKAILELFELEGRCYMGECYSDDVGGYFYTAPMDNGLFYGEFYIGIQIYCIAGELDNWADRLDSFAKQIMNEFSNTNICLEVNPRPECYSLYFGRYPKGEAVELQKGSLRTYARHFYFPECGWAHYISGATADLGIENGVKELAIEKLGNGGTLVRPKTPISALTVSDLKSVKQCVYNTIMPRENEITNITEYIRLRRYWENVPVFENELVINDNGVKFIHYGSVDADIMCSELRIFRR